MTREQLDRMWNNPENWYGLGYSCPEDPRLIVPKRVKWTGYTMNFAHGRSWLALAAIIGAIIAPFGLPFVMDFTPGTIAAIALFTVIILFLIYVCHWESTRER